MSRPSHTQYVPHIGRPHSDPVISANAVNNAPSGAACFAADESSIVQQRTEIREGQFGDLRSGGNSLLIKVDRLFGLTKLITELAESSRRMENSLTVGWLQPRQNAMSVYQIGLRPRAIAVLLVQRS